MALTPLPASPKLVYMPLIAPPAGGGSYAGVPAIGATDNGDQGLQFVLDQATDKTVYAVCNGTVKWLPAGQPLPSGTVARAAGVQLTVSADMVKELVDKQPDGLPPLTNFVYQGLDLASFRAVVVAKVAALPLGVLDTDWFQTHTSDPALQTQADKQASFVTNVLAGASTVEVTGGDRLGQVQADANNSSAYPLQFRAYEGDLIDDPALLGGKINQVVAASPLYFIRYLPEIARSAVWLGHPLLAATSAFTRGAKFYIGFQVSDITAGPRNPNRSNPDGTHVVDPHYATYLGVEAGSQVHLYDHHNPGTPVATATTNSQGLVYFELTPAQAAGTADYYFVIEAPATALVALGQTQPLQLPAIWATGTSSTDYWLAANGRTKGYLANFKGFQLGNAVSPVWFNIGVDYLFDFSFVMPDYLHNSVNTQRGLLPQDLQVSLVSTTGTRLDHVLGESCPSAIYGLSFSLKPGELLTFKIPLELTNSAIGLQRTRLISIDQVLADTTANFNVEYWDSSKEPNKQLYIITNKSSLRVLDVINAKGKSVQISDDVACAALASLTYTRELASVLHYLTDGEYQGTNLSIKLFHIAESLLTVNILPYVPAVAQAIAKHYSLTPLSFPLHSLYLTQDSDRRQRSLVVHESSHQVMYNVSAFSSFDILQRFIYQQLGTGAYHNSDLLSSTFLALTEGWAEAMGGIMCGYPIDMCLNPNSVTRLDEPDPTKIPASGSDGFTAPVAKQRTYWRDEVVWLRDRSDTESPELTWYSLDPAPYKPGTVDERLNRGESSEGAFAMLLYTLFWDFVVNPTLNKGVRYVVADPTGEPTRTNSWMTPANRPAISRRFKALFWQPLQDLATESDWFKKNTTHFIRHLATHATAATNDLNWSDVRARLLLWNMGFPHPGETNAAFAWPSLRGQASDVQRGARAGGNTARYTGQGFVAAYAYVSPHHTTPFREVYMKLVLGSQPATHLVVESPTQLSFTVPAAASPGPVRVTLQLWVRGVQVWEDYVENHYVYL